MSAFKFFFVEKYTLFTFIFFKSKHDISLSIIKRQTKRQDFRRLNTNKKENFFFLFSISMFITTGQEENKPSEKFNSRAQKFGSLCCCNLESDSKVQAYTITRTSLITTTACTNLQTSLRLENRPPSHKKKRKINYKYVYSSTSVGFSGPSAVSPPESLAASLSQARGFISLSCSYQAVRLKVNFKMVSTSDIILYTNRQKRIFFSLLCYFLSSFLWRLLPLVFQPVRLWSGCHTRAAPIYSVKCTHLHAFFSFFFFGKTKSQIRGRFQ